jgi:hypothetical protein
MQVTPGALATLVGIAGTGLAMAVPDQRWIGWVLVILAIAIFSVQFRYENGHVAIGWSAVSGAKMLPMIGMIASALAFVGFGVWYQVASQDGVQMKILNVAFDPNGPGELYVEFQLANLGPPTTLEDWNLSIGRARAELWSHAPRLTFSPRYNQWTGGLDSPIDLSARPLASGEQMRPRFTWTFPGDAKQTFDYPGTTFRLSARDIRGREVSDTFVVK